MADDVVLPAVPVIPPAPASDAPPEHHASWLSGLLRAASLVEHVGVRIVENPIVLALLTPQERAIAAVIGVVGTAAMAETSSLPAAPPVASPPSSSTPTGA